MINSPNFKKSLDFVTRWEGGWSQDQKNPGESKMRGISQNTYDRYRYSKDKPKQMVKLISEDEVTDIYYTHFWVNSDCLNLEYPICLIHFDTLIKDGIDISKTFLALAKKAETDPARVAGVYLDLRRQHYQELIQSNYTNYFSKAILSRCNSLKSVILDYQRDRKK